MADRNSKPCNDRSRHEGSPRASQVEAHKFCDGPKLLIRGDLALSRFDFQKLSAALETMGLRGVLTLDGFKIEPLSGSSARVN